MYIEFALEGIKTSGEILLLRRELLDWSKKYGVSYREKTIKYTHRITFDQDETYSFWAITWNPNYKFKLAHQYRIVSDLNNKI